MKNELQKEVDNMSEIMAALTLGNITQMRLEDDIKDESKAEIDELEKAVKSRLRAAKAEGRAKKASTTN